MSISTIDMFSIGVGPSSSHTVGPLRAADHFAQRNAALFDDDAAAPVHITLHGSLAATGVGHGSDRAAVLGLVGYSPTTLSADVAPAFGTPVPLEGTARGPRGELGYTLEFSPEPLPQHPNAVTFSIPGRTETYYSVGGGFVLSQEEMDQRSELKSGASTARGDHDLPYPFDTGAELLELCERHQMSIPELMLANEVAIHGSAEEVYRHLDEVWETMQDCVRAGISAEGTLPGGLQVERRARAMHEQARAQSYSAHSDPLWAVEWVNLYALAVNEENAAGGRIVTAPTNGAAGIVPAALHYARDFRPDFGPYSHRDFLLAAAAVGIIIKENASISGAEVGCQGEVGSACAMAAAGLCQIIGGTPEQVEHAAEVALEHNLGLTCDPVAGLVQVPCIERNAIGAVKAINAARMSYRSTGKHLVTLDDVVKTMADTGRDMLTKYKETSTGGLAVNLGFPVSITEC